jgi:NAD(P)-dependent dehydrogenase (short-subunit alcohol dehydrogenase family)
MKLKDRVAIITGGGTGIGKAMANLFASEGAAVVIASRTLANLEQTAGEIKSKGGRATVLPMDLNDEVQISRMVAQTLEEYGQIDILVNNSAALVRGNIEVADMNTEAWNQVMMVNLTGTMACCREALRSMKARRSGIIINVSSIAGTSGVRYAGAYCTSKWGILGLTETLAVEAGEYNIRVNSLSPAGTNTENFRNHVRAKAEAMGKTYEEMMGRVLRSYSLGRLADTAEVAKAALFLASDDSSAITGHNLIVSCGFHLLHFREELQ